MDCPHPLLQRRTRAFARIVLPAALLALAGCGSASMDCSGDGEVAGGFSDSSGTDTLTFRHGIAWRAPDGPYGVLFTDDPVLADAGRVSPNPEYEIALAAQMVGALLVGYRFHADGTYHQYFTVGGRVSSGRSGADRGRIAVDDDGCARGDVQLDDYGDGAFALPLIDPERNAAMLVESVERDTRPEADGTDGDTVDESAPFLPDALAEWTAAHATLMLPDPAQALQSLNFSPGTAARLAQHAGVLAALERVRRQCPDPATATLDAYGDVIGASHPAPGVVLHGTVLMTGAGAVRLCYAMQRNGGNIEQCFPMQEDCSGAMPMPIEP